LRIAGSNRAARYQEDNNHLKWQAQLKLGATQFRTADAQGPTIEFNNF
jgi:hypothetical protein